jgi:hypothetical protein
MNNHFKVSGIFVIEVSKMVAAKTEHEAKTKLRDYAIKCRRIKKSDWKKDEAQAFCVD